MNLRRVFTLLATFAGVPRPRRSFAIFLKSGRRRRFSLALADSEEEKRGDRVKVIEFLKDQTRLGFKFGLQSSRIRTARPDNTRTQFKRRHW